MRSPAKVKDTLRGYLNRFHHRQYICKTYLCTISTDCGSFIRLLLLITYSCSVMCSDLLRLETSVPETVQISPKSILCEGQRSWRHRDNVDVLGHGHGAHDILGFGHGTHDVLGLGHGHGSHDVLGVASSCRYSNVPWSDCDPLTWLRTKSVELVRDKKFRFYPFLKVVVSILSWLHQELKD